MAVNRNKNHPRNVIINKETTEVRYTKRSICSTKTGSYSCFRINRKSDFSQYGAGVVAYFQFLKFMIWLFLLMTICAIPSMIFFYSGNKNTSDNFRSLLVQFSLGNIGYESPACNTGTYVTTSSSNGKSESIAEIQMQCSYGTMESMTSFGQVSVNDVIKCKEIATATTMSDQVVFYPSTCESDQWTKDDMDQIQTEFDS